MLRQLIVIWVGVVCLVGGARANNQLDEHVYSAGDALYEGLIEMGRQSTVYNFNFNNLIIIVILKLLVLVILGGLGFGFGLGARSFQEEESIVDGSDMLFMLTYLVSDGLERYDCLNRLACLDDAKAQDLLTASKMMIKGAKYLQPFFDYSTEKYEIITNGLQDAIEHKRQGGSCHLRYQCHAMPSL